MSVVLPGAILLDCVSMVPAAGLVTARDRQAACYLETRFPDLPPRGALFQSLQSARAELSGEDYWSAGALDAELWNETPLWDSMAMVAVVITTRSHSNC